MNAMNVVVPSLDDLTLKVREHMRYVHESALFNTKVERIDALKAEYASHLYVKGSFAYEDGALTFVGAIASCETSIRVHV
jgi:hypothetical protein